ncbi:MAG: hypothetical protein HRU82_03400 [Nitrospira sp.]|nr:MAG: hypothetical protein HRU82_03400 [Nitrospira sp.]
MISSIQQYIHNPDGTISLKGRPGVRVQAIQEQDLERATAAAHAMEQALSLPHYYEQWQALAHATGMSSRMVRFILADESVSRLSGNPRYQPRNITWPASCGLEFGHRGFLVGMLTSISQCFDLSAEALKTIGVDVPVEGACLVGEAQLFNSRLADKAWEAIQRGIFTHVCPLLYQQPNEPLGAGKLVEVSLVTGELPGCQNARILKAWHW